MPGKIDELVEAAFSKVTRSSSLEDINKAPDIAKSAAERELIQELVESDESYHL